MQDKVLKAPSGKTVGEIIKVFRSAFKGYGLKLFALWALILGGVGAGLITPLFYRDFFDTLTSGQPPQELTSSLLKILLWILGINLIGWVGWRGGALMHNFVETKVMAALRERSFHYLMGHSYGFFAENFSGSLVQKTNRLVRAFESLLDSLNWNILPLILRLVVIITVIFNFNLVLGLILLTWTILFMGINYSVSIWKMKYDTASASKESELTGAMSDAITNHMNVQIFSAHEREAENFHGISEKHRRSVWLAWNLEEMLNAVQAMLAIVAEFLLIYFAIRYWEKGALTIGTFILLQTYLGKLIDQLWDFGRMMRHVYRSFADAEEMVSILKTEHAIKDAPTAEALQLKKGEIEFRHVHFGFHGKKDVIQELDLTIRPGEKVALIGPSGAGKSTIVKLLFRFYDVARGEILIDGKDITQVTQKSLRSAIALVPQEPILFHRSLFENIRYGRPGASKEEVYRAAKLAHCEEFISNLPEGYDTFVGERGIKLSGGERQRIAIARAILKDAPILALDEATSSLDSHSEHLIQEAMDVLMRGKTVIVIAHRLSTIQKMDRIIVIENGRVREEGTHKDLMRSPESLYSHLWQLQAGGFLAEEDEGEEKEVLKEDELF